MSIIKICGLIFAMKQVISRLEKEKGICEKYLQISAVEKCNFIVEVGAFTVSTDSFGRTILCNASEPAQFSKSAVDKILTINFINRNGVSVLPKVYTKYKWYLEKFNALDYAIKHLKLL